MRIVLICELVALLVFPFIVAILHRRGLRFEKPMAIALATLLGLLMGSYWLYLINPETLFSLTALVHKSKSRRNPSIGLYRLGNFKALRHTQMRHSIESGTTD